ncbi:MAG: tRNA (adenosine(37)-N6)-threonylcarbamoyltransferase complex transferase subunit TsaD [Deltaproteobacteria bacterium]|nr:MAG: tRNA (adenosine(37)-N6)-threonylcarbamoyltransferase complex transferase subunit TsaD [Deltaproteobacteria bacterium]
MIVLGIESSCDETAAAIVENGEKVLSSIVSSQIDIHHRYGGVVPELASRKHIESIVPVVNEAIHTSGKRLSEINGVAVTQGPGLIGCLLVGFSFAKAWAWSRDIPVVGVDHLEGHINSVFICDNPPQFPFVALLVSGGHTSIYHVTSHTQNRVMGRTRDDAAGEAYDKVAKMLNLGYPGGSIIDELAAKGDSGKIRFPRSYLDKDGFDFSFSGMKTAVNRYIQNHPNEYQEQAADIAAGFQEAVTDVLCFKLMKAALEAGCSHITVVGGVAANKGLREKIRSQAAGKNMTVHIPPIDLCGDNAAMIAATGYHYLKAGQRLPLEADVYSRIKRE